MFLNLIETFKYLENFPHAERLEQLLRLAGCTFYEPGLLRSPAVRMVAIGGLPVTNAEPLALGGTIFPIEQVAHSFNETRGLGGALTYLNPKNKSLTELCEQQALEEHFSTAHACYITLGIFGLTSACEHEFDCQRDLLHLQRLTVARTMAQNNPPLVVFLSEHLAAVRAVRSAIQTIRSGIRSNALTSLESANNLWPKSAATAVLVSGTLNNWRKVIAQKYDTGKEIEYRRFLERCEVALFLLAPDMFKPPVFASCVIIEHEEDPERVLVIERTDGSGIGLIAGKVNPDEDAIQTAGREANEESSLIIAPSDLEPIYDGPTDDGYRAQTFRARAWSGEPRSSSEGKVYWGTWNELMGTNSAFADYNRRAYAALKSKR